MLIPAFAAAQGMRMQHYVGGGDDGLVTQSCLTLCDPMDCSPPGSSVHRDCTGKNAGVGCHTLRQGIFPDPGIEPVSCRAGRFFTTEPFGKPQCYVRTGGKSKTSGDRRQIFSLREMLRVGVS